MTYQFPPDVDQLIRDQMATGRYLSEADLLRDALRALADDEQDLAAIREAIADFEAGEPGVPLDAAFDAVRRDASIQRGT